MSLFRAMLTHYPNIDMGKVRDGEVGFGGRSMGNRAGCRRVIIRGIESMFIGLIRFIVVRVGMGWGIRDEE